VADGLFGGVCRDDFKFLHLSLSWDSLLQSAWQAGVYHTLEKACPFNDS